MADTYRNKLEEVSQQFQRDTSFFMHFGFELECYAPGYSLEDMQQLVGEFEQNAGFVESQVIEEDGEFQYEIVGKPCNDSVRLAEHIEALKAILFLQQKKPISLAAKPYESQPGSALHIHISLYDKAGQNLFVRKSDGNEESNYLLWSVAGLLEALLASMPIFAPAEADYIRYRFPDRNTSATISWGGDNRTVALRLPPVGEDVQNRRIEHRVPAPNANAYQVFMVIITAIGDGLKAKRPPSVPKVFGNAWDEQYGLKFFPDFEKRG